MTERARREVSGLRRPNQTLGWWHPLEWPSCYVVASDYMAKTLGRLPWRSQSPSQSLDKRPSFLWSEEPILAAVFE